MDGMFVPNLTFGAPIIKCARHWTDIPFDAHLMIEDPVRYIEDFAKAGCDSITVHTEAEGDIMAAVDKIHDLGLKAGITMNRKMLSEMAIADQAAFAAVVEAAKKALA